MEFRGQLIVYILSACTRHSKRTAHRCIFIHPDFHSAKRNTVGCVLHYMVRDAGISPAQSLTIRVAQVQDSWAITTGWELHPTSEDCATTIPCQREGSSLHVRYSTTPKNYITCKSENTATIMSVLLSNAATILMATPCEYPTLYSL